ncbi:hypothetical protein B0H16DRAFT_1781268 [Mycena metata]|uniref:CxC5 like cysteine cluster associated with KDZ domain-containing protein n=1 Tax=Mycena metata TaxID=1033252 RepID=A0AAD7JPI4_9AGAR|nr:hypothetical protein B0H16DRAFT_1781268 [Mycena metata]
MSLHQITAVIQNCPELGLVSFHGLNLFIHYASLARETIEVSQRNKLVCPTEIPPHILRTLATVLGEKDTRLTEICWTAFRELVWTQPIISPTVDEILAYNDTALIHQTSFRHLYPPTRSCKTPDCVNHRDDENILTLVEPLTHTATLFTLEHGALPVYTTSLYYRACKTRYYHNYHVHKKTSVRSYYGGVPDVVQVAQHFFIESALLELFANNMVFGWLSATNCARFYNQALSTPRQHVLNNKFAFTAIYHNTRHLTPDDWNTTSLIRKENTMNGFFLYSLLLDKAEHGGILMLPHDEQSQSDHMEQALAERNM